MNDTVYEIPRLLSRLSQLYAQRLRWTEQYHDRISRFERIEAGRVSGNQSLGIGNSENHESHFDSKMGNQTYTQHSSKVRASNTYLSSYYSRMKVPLFSLKPSKSPLEQKYENWRWGIEYFGSAIKWKQLLCAWTRDSISLKQWPFQIEPITERKFQREVLLQKELHTLDIETGTTCIRLVVLIRELEQICHMVKKPISTKLLQYLYQHRPSMIKVTRGIATGEFLSLWIELNNWWKEFELLYLPAIMQSHDMQLMRGDIPTFMNDDSRRHMLSQQSHHSTNILNSIQPQLKKHILLHSNPSMLRKPQTATKLQSLNFLSYADQNISQLARLVQYHLSEENQVRWDMFQLSTLSLGNKLQKRQVKKSVNFMHLLQKTLKKTSRNWKMYQESLISKMGIVEDFYKITKSLEHVARLLPQDYFREIINMDVLWISDIVQIQKNQFNESPSNLATIPPQGRTNLKQFVDIEHGRTFPKGFISKIFQFISQSRLKQCLDRLAYNEAFHDECELFGRNIDFVSIRHEKKIELSENYSTLLKYYCLVQMNHTKDPKKIEWYAECQNLINLIESHFASKCIPDRQTFVRFTRMYANQIARFDAFQNNPLISLLKRQYAIRMTIAYVTKAFSIEEMTQYAELYIYYRRMKRLPFTKFVNHMKDFRNVYKKLHFSAMEYVVPQKIEVKKGSLPSYFEYQPRSMQPIPVSSKFHGIALKAPIKV